MFDDGFTVGRLFGIRLKVSPSWLIILALVTFAVGGVYLPMQHPRWPQPLYWAAGLGAGLLFFLCVVLHELAHSLVAIRNNIPVRSITLFLFGGVSHISKDAPSPGVEFAIAVVGPLTSLGLGAIAGALFWLLRGQNDLLSSTFFWLAQTNLGLGLFNLLPGFPLDGGRVLRSIVWYAAEDFRWATQVATRWGQATALTLMLAGGFLIFGHRASGLGSGFWLLFIGWFLFTAANGSYRSMLTLQLLQGVLIRDVMRREPAQIEASRPMSELAEALLANPGRDPFVVVRDGQAIGLAGRGALRGLVPERLSQVRIGDAMRPLAASALLPDDLPAGQALQAMIESRSECLPVIAAGQVVGLLLRDDLLRLVEIRRRLNR